MKQLLTGPTPENSSAPPFVGIAESQEFNEMYKKHGTVPEASGEEAEGKVCEFNKTLHFPDVDGPRSTSCPRLCEATFRVVRFA